MVKLLSTDKPVENKEIFINVIYYISGGGPTFKKTKTNLKLFGGGLRFFCIFLFFLVLYTQTCKFEGHGEKCTSKPGRGHDSRGLGGTVGH